MRRSARVSTVSAVQIPESGADALEIRTDLAEPRERAFYLRPDSPRPELMTPIAWGDHRAWYQLGGRTIVARKLDYNFDPDAPLA
jgi:hypothetical protein